MLLDVESAAAQFRHCCRLSDSDSGRESCRVVRGDSCQRIRSYRRQSQGGQVEEELSSGQRCGGGSQRLPRPAGAHFHRLHIRIVRLLLFVHSVYAHVHKNDLILGFGLIFVCNV